MAEPVIIDDGGSTRIRQVKLGKCEMDTIMDWSNANNPNIGPGKKWSKQDISDTIPYNQIRIVCIDKCGCPREVLVPAFHKILISCSLGQSILVKKVTSHKIRLTLFGNIEPIVDAKQHRKKLRYVVTNSGPIEKIELDGNLVYEVAAHGLPIMQPAVPKPIVYTSVVIS